jgi:cell division protein FtsQ
MIGRLRGRRGADEPGDSSGANPAGGPGSAEPAAVAAGAVRLGASEPGTTARVARGDSARPEAATGPQPGPAGADGQATGPKEDGQATGSKAAGSKVTGRRGRDPWRAAFFGVLILAILGGGAWALLGSSLLVVRHQEVTGNRLVAAAEVVAAAGIRDGTPLASVNTAAAARRVDQISQILSATVSRSWPDTIVISVRERTPVLAVASDGGFALIDRTGVGVRWSRHRPAALPLFDPPPGQLRGSPAVAAAAAVLRLLPARLRARLAAIAAPSAQRVTLQLRGGITVLWGTASQSKTKAQEVIALLRTGARYYDVSDPTTAVTQG